MYMYIYVNVSPDLCIMAIFIRDRQKLYRQFSVSGVGLSIALVFVGMTNFFCIVCNAYVRY